MVIAANHQKKFIWFLRNPLWRRSVLSRWFVGRRSFIFVTEVVHTKPAKRNCCQKRFTDANTNTNQKYKYKYKYTASYHTCRPAHWEVWGLRLKSRELCTFITACQRLMYRKAIISIIIKSESSSSPLWPSSYFLEPPWSLVTSYLRLMCCTPVNVIVIRVSLYAWSGDEIQNTRFWTSRNSRKEKHYHCEKGRLLHQILGRMWGAEKLESGVNRPFRISPQNKRSHRPHW